MKKYKIFLLLLAALGMVGLPLGEAGPADNAATQGDLLAKATGMPALSAASPQALALAPFFLIHEKDAKIWIERVIVTVEFDRTLSSTAEFIKPEQRSQIFDILTAESEKGPLPSLVKTAINQSLGEETVTSVRLSRSFLLF